MTIGFDLDHDLDLDFSRSNIQFAISQPKMVRLPRNKKQTYGVNLRAQIYQIVTGVTSVVGVPSTHLVLVIVAWGISCEIALRWMSLDLNGDIKSTLVQVMDWCHQATSHYLGQGWPRSLSPYAVFTKIIRHIGHFRWLGPSVWWDFTNLNRIYKAHLTNVWWTMKVFWLHSIWCH